MCNSMTGWLIVNNFLKSDKFSEIYEYLMNAAKKRGIDIVMKKSGECMYYSGEKVELPDFVLFWDKDINLAKHLENMGARLFNSADAIEKCDNKALCALQLAKEKIKIPKTYIAPKTFENIGYCNLEFLEIAARNLGYPFVIKESFGSFGQQVYLANDFNEAEKIVRKIGHRDFIMQEFIKKSAGCDVRINVVGNRAVSAAMRKSVNGDFRSNVSNGGIMQKFEISEKQKEVAQNACRALGLDFAGVDVLLGDEDCICEINSNPHFKSTLECTGLDMSEEIMEYIFNTLKKEKENDRLADL